jgi:hypothetical protein
LMDNVKMGLRGIGWGGMAWTDLASGGLLWTRWWTFGFHKMLGITWVTAQLAAFQEGFSSMELVSCYSLPYIKLKKKRRFGNQLYSCHPAIVLYCIVFLLLPIFVGAQSIRETFSFHFSFLI